MNLLEILLGQLPEALYFAIFMIFAKGLKEKRLQYIAIMIFEYLALKHFIHYNIWFQVAYTFMTYLSLKILYKEKAQIVDIVTFTIASIILIISSAICFFACFQNVIVASIVNRVILFVLLFAYGEKLSIIRDFYRKFWNRHNDNGKIKSVTVRCITVVIFNIMFYIINIGMMFAIIYNK